MWQILPQSILQLNAYKEVIKLRNCSTCPKRDYCIPDEFWFRYYESDTNVPIDNIGVGDWVVVKSRNGLGVARVLKKAKDLDTVRMQGFKGNVVKQVIAVIDTSKCDKRESGRAKLEDIEKKLEQKAKNAERLTMYRLLAKDNPEFSALLTEYESVKASVDEL